jgi:hypothetical protein
VGVSNVATSAAVRQKLVVKRPEVWPSVLIVASATGMELCLNPSV